MVNPNAASMLDDRPRRDSILVLNENVSGMNRFFFRELGKDYDLIVKDVQQPEARRYWHALATFQPNRARWKRRFSDARTQYWKSPGCFDLRSRLARRIVETNSEFSAALQIGAMFDGFSQLSNKPKLGFCSWNILLSHREWAPWAPYPSEREFLAYYERERSYYHSLDRILCTNEYVMASLVRDYSIPSERLTHIGYGVNFDTLPDLPKTFASNLALFVGYDFERKGGPAVVSAFKRARSKAPHARLRIVGPASLEAQYRVEGVEHVPNVTDRTALMRHFVEADFFVMPSVCEPFGLVFLEAMALKNACIGSTNDAMPEIIQHGVTGFTVGSEDVEGLASHMANLFLDFELRQRLGLAAYDRVRRMFTWEICGLRARSAVRDVLSARK